MVLGVPEWTQNGSKLIGKWQKISKMASKTWKLKDRFFDDFLDCQKTSPTELREQKAYPKILIFRPGERLPLTWRVNPSDPTQACPRLPKTPRDASRRHKTPRDDATRRNETPRDATRRHETPRDASETRFSCKFSRFWAILSPFWDPRGISFRCFSGIHVLFYFLLYFFNEFQPKSLQLSICFSVTFS